VSCEFLEHAVNNYLLVKQQMQFDATKTCLFAAKMSQMTYC